MVIADQITFTVKRQNPDRLGEASSRAFSTSVITRAFRNGPGEGASGLSRAGRRGIETGWRRSYEPASKADQTMPRLQFWAPFSRHEPSVHGDKGCPGF